MWPEAFREQAAVSVVPGEILAPQPREIVTPTGGERALECVYTALRGADRPFEREHAEEARAARLAGNRRGFRGSEHPEIAPIARTRPSRAFLSSARERGRFRPGGSSRKPEVEIRRLEPYSSSRQTVAVQGFAALRATRETAPGL